MSLRNCSNSAVSNNMIHRIQKQYRSQEAWHLASTSVNCCKNRLPSQAMATLHDWWFPEISPTWLDLRTTTKYRQDKGSSQLKPELQYYPLGNGYHHSSMVFNPSKHAELTFPGLLVRQNRKQATNLQLAKSIEQQILKAETNRTGQGSRESCILKLTQHSCGKR